jgi:threonine dehydrogenase-like Zn-dependent dehydrogenase
VGVAATLGQALAAVRYGGRVIWLGNVEPEVVIPCNPVLSAERSLKGSYAYTAAEYREAVAMIDERRIDLAPLLGETCSLEEAPAMFAALASGAGRAVKVVVEP